MSKYIIKNCPAIYEYGKGLCCNDLKFDEHTLCQDCTDCVLKQIVEGCKGTEKYYSECITKNRETFGQYMDEENMTWLMGRSHHSLEILRLLDIQEVE